MEEIRAQLAYRAENAEKLKDFHPGLTFATDEKVCLDSECKQMIVTSAEDWISGNPDIIDLDRITEVETCIEDNEEEIFFKDKDGNEKSYNPPRYRYAYEFYITFRIDSPWFDEISVDLNNGERTLYTRDEDAEPIHDSGKYDWFFQETGGEIVPLALTGGWTGASEDGYVMFLELAADGNMIWFCKKEGEPVFFHIGVAEVDPETGTITTISERVGCADMPGLYDIEYTFAADGTLLLKNPELGGILPGDEAIAFTKTTGKEGGV